MLSATHICGYWSSFQLLDNVIVPEGNEKGSRRKKPLPATYEPDKRTAAWLKLKKDYVNGIGDSIDLVPIGAWYGNGRKVKWWSPVLMGLYDPISGRFVAVCKCMSGEFCLILFQIVAYQMLVGFTDKFYQVRRSNPCLAILVWRQSRNWERYIHRQTRSGRHVPHDHYGIVTLEASGDFSIWQGLWLSMFAGFKPDVYFQPHEVWEIRGAEYVHMS